MLQNKLMTATLSPMSGLLTSTWTATDEAWGCNNVITNILVFILSPMHLCVCFHLALTHPNKRIISARAIWANVEDNKKIGLTLPGYSPTFCGHSRGYSDPDIPTHCSTDNRADKCGTQSWSAQNDWSDPDDWFPGSIPKKTTPNDVCGKSQKRRPCGH